MAQKILIPGMDAEYDAFMTNLFGKATTNEVAWNIPSTAVTPSVVLLSSWGTSYGITSHPTTTTSVNITKKNKDKKALTAFPRPFIKKWIYLNDSMDDADRLSCGCPAHSTTRVKGTKPATLPLMDYKLGNGHTIWGYYRQAATEPGTTKAGKPDGVGSIQIAWFVGTLATVPADPSDYGNIVIATKSPVALIFAATQAGLTVFLAARWVSANNINGDWTQEVSRTIP